METKDLRIVIKEALDAYEERDKNCPTLLDDANNGRLLFGTIQGILMTEIIESDPTLHLGSREEVPITITQKQCL